jgi:hypothetical protein
MRKLFLAGIISLLGVSALMAQSKPIIGYDKVPWGTSIEDVKKAYPNYNLEEIDFSDWDEEAMGMPRPVYRCFASGVDGNISRREFLFYNNRLFQVDITYDVKKIINTNIIESTIRILSERYGPDVAERNSFVLNITEIRHSDELKIIINKGVSYPGNVLSVFVVNFINPKVVEQMELDQVQF